jgi:hypothetical protein
VSKVVFIVVISIKSGDENITEIRRNDHMPSAKNKRRTKNIDLALSVMCAVAERDETLTTLEIAEICGCSQTYIQEIYRKGIYKLQGDLGLKLRKFV